MYGVERAQGEMSQGYHLFGESHNCTRLFCTCQR